MGQFVITGRKKISGQIKVNGAKNFALKIIPAALLSDQPLTVTGVPEINDLQHLLTILREIGVNVKKHNHDYTFKPGPTIKTELPHNLVRQLRASILLVGPLLARQQRVSLPHPGGCLIGTRPIDQFIKGFQSLGATVKNTANHYVFTTPQGLVGRPYVFTKISVTGTETMLLAAVLAKGTTTLINAACEPEVKALADYLNKQGARISGAGTPRLEITGVNKITAGTCAVIPDRIEAGSFAILAAATKSHLKITNVIPDHLAVPLKILQDMGVPLKIGRNYIEVLPWKKIIAQDIVTREYPGFPTDLQAPLTVLLTQAQGESHVLETIFENRLVYTDILNRMGARIALQNPREIIINGPTLLRGKVVESPDIRAGLALVIAALIAQGETTINNIYQIDRGYEKLDRRLRKLGVRIIRK